MSEEKEEIQVSTYYKEMIPELIKKYKHLVEQCFQIVDEPIDEKVTGDKKHAELRSKRNAMEDAQHYAKQIDDLENKLNGVETVETVEGNETPETIVTNWAKRRAKKPN
jgi:hypothetical protein